MNAMVPGLAGGKMSASDPNSKIDFLDPPSVIKKKIKAAFCEPGNVTENGLLAFVKAVLIPISQLRLERLTHTGINTGILEPGLGDQTPFVSEGAPVGVVFSIVRPEKYGGAIHYTNFEDIEKDFREEVIHPGDLKGAVTDAIIKLLEPIQAIYSESEEWQEVAALAYPDPNAKPVKKKVRFDIWFVQTALMLSLSTQKEKKPQIRPQPANGSVTVADASTAPATEPVSERPPVADPPTANEVAIDSSKREVSDS